jgi:hypothetical protein
MKKSTTNQFGETSTAYIEAIYKDDKFIDKRTGKKVKLTEPLFGEGISVLIEVPISVLSQEDYDYHTSNHSRLVARAGDILYFDLDYKAEAAKFLCEVLLEEDLVISSKGNKPSHSSCNCAVVMVKDYYNKKSIISHEVINADSLHQAFFQASLKYRPKNKSHNCNVYKTFRDKSGNFLGNIGGNKS